MNHVNQEHKEQREQYIQFGIDQEHYAIHIAQIHEIIKTQDIHKIPNVKPYIKGVINLRGQIIPVISLRHLFGLGDDEFTKTTRIIVVHHMEERVGIIVDRVDKVTTFDDIQPPPDRIGEINKANFSGVSIQGGTVIGILKLDQVLKQEGGEVGS